MTALSSNAHRSHVIVERRPGGIVEELVDVVRRQSDEIGELPGEQGFDPLASVQGCEAGITIVAEKERARERAIEVRKCDQHVVAPRPDVQRSRIDEMGTVSRRRHGQLLVGVIEWNDVDAPASGLRDEVAHSRSTSVGTEDCSDIRVVLQPAWLVTKSQSPGGEVAANAPLVEGDGDPATRFGCVQQRRRERLSGDGVDHLIIPDPVRLQ